MSNLTWLSGVMVNRDFRKHAESLQLLRFITAIILLSTTSILNFNYLLFRLLKYVFQLF